MCVSIFVVICSIVRITSVNIIGGQVDSMWVLLWLNVEACVAVMMVSVTAFRAPFTQDKAYSYPASDMTVLNTRKASLQRGREGSWQTINDGAVEYPMRVFAGTSNRDILQHSLHFEDGAVYGRHSAYAINQVG